MIADRYLANIHNLLTQNWRKLYKSGALFYGLSFCTSPLNFRVERGIMFRAEIFPQILEMMGSKYIEFAELWEFCITVKGRGC